MYKPIKLNIMKLVIRGAYYYIRDSKTIVVPHYTGEYFIVDCDEYITMDELKKIYDEDYIKHVKNNYIEFENEKYYYAEYSPNNISDDWDLLSDLSDLYHTEENFDF